MMWRVSESAVALFSLFAIVTFYGKHMARRLSLFWMGAASALYVACQYLAAAYGMPGWLQAALLCAACLGLAFSFSTGWKQRALYAAAIAALLLMTEAVAGALVGRLGGMLTPGMPMDSEAGAGSFNMIYIIGVLLARLLALIAIRAHCYLGSKRDCEFPLRHWLAIMLVPLMGIAVCLGLALASGSYLIRHPAASALVVAGIAGTNMLAFTIYDELLAKSKKLVENERSRSRLESDARQYGSVVSHFREFAALLHDSRRHRETVYGLISAGESEAAMRYLEDLLASSPPLYGDAVIRGSPALDALLRRKIAEAEGCGIEVLCDCDMEGVMPVDEVSLCLIFGNALDNAIESCRKLPEGRERRIEVGARHGGGRLTVRIANTSDYVKVENGAAASTKRDPAMHGHGLPNIRRTVERNGGNSVAKYEDGMFILSIIFLL